MPVCVRFFFLIFVSRNIWLYLRACVCVRVRGWFFVLCVLCVCVRERERESFVCMCGVCVFATIRELFEYCVHSVTSSADVRVSKKKMNLFSRMQGWSRLENIGFFTQRMSSPPPPPPFFLPPPPPPFFVFVCAAGGWTEEGYVDRHTIIMYDMACDLTATEELGPGMIFTSFCHHWQAMMFVDAFSSCCIPGGLLLPAWACASVVAILVWSGSSSLYSGLILATFNFALHVWQSVILLCLCPTPHPPSQFY